MKKSLALLFLFFGLVIFSSCSDKENDSVFPSVIRDFCLLHTDDKGTFVELITDDDKIYKISSGSGGYECDAYYRTIANYYIDNNNLVTLYSFKPAYLLPVVEEESCSYDPIGVASVTRSKYFINLHLLPRVQNQDKHTWGYQIIEQGDGYHLLKLIHKQNNDPASYSQDFYCCIQINKIPNFKVGDDIRFVVNTWEGEQSWNLK